MQCKKLFYVSQIIGSLNWLAGTVLEHASVKLLELGPQQPKSKACRRATWKIPSAGKLACDSGSSKTMSRSRILRNPIAFVWWVVLVCCFLIVTISMLRLPEIPLGLQYPTTKTSKQTSEDDNLSIGKFGKMMLEMLPEDLAFTVFVPSEEAFERDLRLSSNESLVGEKMNDDTYAIMSRVLGFSAVPRRLASVNVPIDKELSYDSISGFVLYISKEEDGALTVNRVRSKRVDLRKKGSVVHIMDGVIMDAEFQQSVQPEELD